MGSDLKIEILVALGDVAKICKIEGRWDGSIL
jgi:hypothetical protein